jgi:hypothetical protein
LGVEGVARGAEFEFRTANNSGLDGAIGTGHRPDPIGISPCLSLKVTGQLAYVVTYSLPLESGTKFCPLELVKRVKPISALLMRRGDDKMEFT